MKKKTKEMNEDAPNTKDATHDTICKAGFTDIAYLRRHKTLKNLKEKV